MISSKLSHYPDCDGAHQHYLNCILPPFCRPELQTGQQLKRMTAGANINGQYYLRTDLNWILPPFSRPALQEGRGSIAELLLFISNHLSHCPGCRRCEYQYPALDMQTELNCVLPPFCRPRLRRFGNGWRLKS